MQMLQWDSTLRAPCGLPVWPLVPCGQTRWPDGPSVILFGPRVGGTAQFHRYTAPPVHVRAMYCDYLCLYVSEGL